MHGQRNPSPAHHGQARSVRICPPAATSRSYRPVHSRHALPWLPPRRWRSRPARIFRPRPTQRDQLQPAPAGCTAGADRAEPSCAAWHPTAGIPSCARAGRSGTRPQSVCRWHRSSPTWPWPGRDHQPALLSWRGVPALIANDRSDRQPRRAPGESRCGRWPRGTRRSRQRCHRHHPWHDPSRGQPSRLRAPPRGCRPGCRGCRQSKTCPDASFPPGTSWSEPIPGVRSVRCESRPARCR